MDITDIAASMKNVASSGFTFPVYQRMQLELALHKLNNDTSHDELLFWGKIKGTQADYYIALGLNFKGNYEFPHKDFYWASSSNFLFAPLPEMLDQHKADADILKEAFSGQPDKVLVENEVKKEENPDESEEKTNKKEEHLDSDSQEDESEKIIPTNLKEVDRLGFVVRAIDNQTSVVPEGSYRLTPAHQVRRNGGFLGLKGKDATDLQKYQHFRNVQTSSKKEQIEREDVIFFLNFLDTLDEDAPKGAWAVHQDASNTQVNIRSLLWPGYVGYHRVGTSKFGGVYVGDGIKNADLPFML